MSTQTITDTIDTKDNTKSIIIYVKFNDDEINNIFEKIKEFRNNNLKTLKFTSPYKGLIFLSINSDEMDNFRKLINYSVSTFNTFTKFKCSPEDAASLQSRRDSFIKMKYVDGYVEFRSRVKFSFHKYLVKQIFNHSNVDFKYENYTLVKDFNKYHTSE